MLAVSARFDHADRWRANAKISDQAPRSAAFPEATFAVRYAFRGAPRAVRDSPSHHRAILASPNPLSLRLEPTTTDTQERFLD
jgi:hypothetical protein